MLQDSLLPEPYQTKCNTAQLNYVSVGNRVEPAHPGVEHGYKGRDDYSGVKGNHQDDGKCGPWQWWSQTVRQSDSQSENSPRAARIPADQKTSPHSAGRKSRPPILEP